MSSSEVDGGRAEITRAKMLLLLSCPSWLVPSLLKHTFLVNFFEGPHPKCVGVTSIFMLRNYPRSVQAILLDAVDLIQVGFVQGKCPTYCTIALALLKTILRKQKLQANIERFQKGQVLSR